ncbi:MAG TPA: gamma-glutamylcyclotransferase [Sedimentibacter sp.]|nr:gamma-glutamylcyclotransferase [Sedimentibacter sp.]
MKYTFYRPNETNTETFDKIISDMYEVLVKISNGYAKENELKDYLENLVKDQKCLQSNAEMGFWGFDEPENMPSDARVMYFYTPTYIAIGMLLNTKLNYPETVKQIAGFDVALKKGLLASTGRGFQGHGYDYLDGLIKALNIFVLAKAHIFVELYPNYCQEFTRLLKESLQYCERLIKTNKTKGDWGEDYSIQLNCILQAAAPQDYLKLMSEKKGQKVYLFVYGTLMSTNRSNRAYLDDAEYLGKFTLNGYELYDLGSYPGIVEGNDKVKGELYAVSIDKLDDIDRYEGEGFLYTRKMVQILGEGNEKLNAYTYVYNKPVTGSMKINYENQPWYQGIAKAINNSNLLWYACYGSNINKERFMKYIEGCSDKTPPRDERPFIFDYPIYFSNNSPSWDYKGVAFLDINKKGKSFGKIYLITKEQFEEIKLQEGSNRNWYGKTVCLGSLDGIPVKTITKEERTSDVIPSTRYIVVIKKGIRDTYPEMTLPDIDAYLMKSYLNEYHVSVLKHLRSQAHGVAIRKIASDLNYNMSTVINIINDLRECGLIKQDGRSVASNIMWNDSEAIYYTVEDRREAIT